MNIALLVVDLRQEQHSALARRRAHDIAQLLGFNNQDCVRIATTVSEIARNAWRYAGGGRVEFRLVREAEHDVFVIDIRDQGPGIPNLTEILDGRYRSSTGMGLGLLSGRRLMHRFDINTSAQGTVVSLGRMLPSRASEPLPVIAARVATGLVQFRGTDPVAEIEERNRELLQALSDQERSQSELSQVNRELEETNRGVVALYAELDDRAREIQKVIDLKTRFLSNITHEFRTPLNSIIGLSRMLIDRLDGELSPEQEKQTRFIHRAARDLSELVNDLLDLAKADAGKVELTPSVISVNELFATLRGMLRPLIDHNPAVTLVFAEPPASAQIVCDEKKLSQILRNLISNALKYTPSGEVHVSASLAGPRIVFRVRDTGIGIPEEHREKIFEEFYQVRNPLQQKNKGTGLGLALSRRLADLLGGALSVQSTVGLGSTFQLDLPLSTLPQTADAPLAPPVSSENEIVQLVLFVDERVDALFGYERMLDHTSFKAILARDTQEALNILQRVSVSAIVTSSARTAQLLAALLPPSASLIPAFIVAGEKTPADDEPSSLIDAFVPAAPTPQQLLECLQKLVSPAHLSALVIDDSPEARHTLRTVLEEFHLGVLEAGTAAEALAVIQERRPALVFSEIVLSDGTGIQFVADLQRAVADGALIIHSSRVFSDEERDYLKNRTTALIRKGPSGDTAYRTAIIHELARSRRRNLRA